MIKQAFSLGFHQRWAQLEKQARRYYSDWQPPASPRQGRWGANRDPGFSVPGVGNFSSRDPGFFPPRGGSALSRDPGFFPQDSGRSWDMDPGMSIPGGQGRDMDPGISIPGSGIRGGGQPYASYASSMLGSPTGGDYMPSAPMPDRNSFRPQTPSDPVSAETSSFPGSSASPTGRDWMPNAPLPTRYSFQPQREDAPLSRSFGPAVQPPPQYSPNQGINEQLARNYALNEKANPGATARANSQSRTMRDAKGISYNSRLANGLPESGG